MEKALITAGASAHLLDCHLCPHRCGEERAAANGVCRVGQESYIASEMLHVGEEKFLSPSHAIFFSGCTATCTFCTAAKFAFRPTYGVVVHPQQLANRILQRQSEGARSVSFIGGDPAPHIPFIVETLQLIQPQRTIPSVFNSNFYLTHTALDLLDGEIDIYLPDLKFGPATNRTTADGKNCGEELGGMPNYWSVVTECIDRIYREKKRIVVRHLLMPNHFTCCTEPVLRWLAERPEIGVSLLTQYLAPAHAGGEMGRVLAAEEIAQAQKLARDLSLRLVE